MTKHTIEFGFDFHGLKIKKDMKTIQLKNFFLKPPNELVKLGYLPPVVRSISPPIKMNQAEHRYIILVERKPVTESLRATWEEDEYGGVKAETSFNIPLPWQHYFVVLTASAFAPISTKTMALYFSQSSLSSLDHKFYTPYLPNVYTDEVLYDHTLVIHTGDHHCEDEECYEKTSIENLCFPPQSYSIDEGGFSYAFDRLYSAYWHGSRFNADLYTAPIDFVAGYDKSYWQDIEDERLDIQIINCLERIAEIPFDTILSDAVFTRLDPVFTFSDYLKTVGNSATQELFDFKVLFDEGLDAGKVIKTVEQEYKPFQVQQPVVGIWQDNQGKWRRADGKFASSDEILAVRGY